MLNLPLNCQVKLGVKLCADAIAVAEWRGDVEVNALWNTCPTDDAALTVVEMHRRLRVAHASPAFAAARELSGSLLVRTRATLSTP